MTARLSERMVLRLQFRVLPEVQLMDEPDELDAFVDDGLDRLSRGDIGTHKRNGNSATKEGDKQKVTQANRLIALSASAKLFHTSDGNCYADVDINGHRETWPVRSKGFRRWLTRRYFEEEAGAPNNESISTALGMIEAHAHFNSRERTVHVRVGGMDGKLYLDLCDTDWRAVEIDAAGWRVISNPPVRFRGFATRTLYSDQDETLFESSRPIILNGIEDIITKPDLAERSLLMTLQPISEDMRRTEKELWGAFEIHRPFILGALLGAVSHGLKRLPETRLAKLPRMADFALWGTACETAAWADGAFGAAYANNLNEATGNVIDADPVASSIRILMKDQVEWTGAASELLGVITEAVGDRVAKAKDWPGTPKALTGRLRRASPLLRKLGIDIKFLDRTDHKQPRTIVISCRPADQAKRSAPHRPHNRPRSELRRNV